MDTPLGERLRMAIALEEANPDLTGAAGVNQVPDLVVRVRWDPGAPRFRFGLLAEGSHIQAALLLRQLRGEVAAGDGTTARTLATSGYGLNLSGVVPASWGSTEDHRLCWAWNVGKGIGRYIADLGSAGGQDAFVGGEDEVLEALP